MIGAERSAASSTCLSSTDLRFSISPSMSFAATRCAPIVAKPVISSFLSAISFCSAAIGLSLSLTPISTTGAERSAVSSTCLSSGVDPAISLVRSAIGFILRCTSLSMTGAERSTAPSTGFRSTDLRFATSASTSRAASAWRYSADLSFNSLCSDDIGDFLMVADSTTGAAQRENQLASAG